MSTGLEPNLIIFDELNDEEPGIWHTVCCKDEHMRLCGSRAPEGVTGEACDSDLLCLTCDENDKKDICPHYGSCIDPKAYSERWDN